MKILFILAAALAVVAHASNIDEKWQAFKFKYGKSYKSLLDEKRRFAIFKSNVRSFVQHNMRFFDEEVSYTKSINQFADMTYEEFAATLSPLPPKQDGIPRELFNDTGVVADEEINWVTKGLVTNVKNQGKCGSCWAFSAVGAIEGQIAKTGEPLVSLSPQNLVDCATFGNHGCNGGLADNAFTYVIVDGVLTDDEYPYVGHQSACKNKGGQKIADFVDIAKNEAALLKALSTVGPISVGIEASHLSSYSSGIFDTSSGCTSSINHGVLLVGAGTEYGKDYWLIKNSWGETWGESGYFKLIRNKSACGIYLQNSYPIL